MWKRSFMFFCDCDLQTQVWAQTHFPCSRGCQQGEEGTLPQPVEHPLKHCWLGPVPCSVFLEYGQVCGQRSGGDVVGLMHSWSAVFQHFVLGFLFFPFLWKISVKQSQSQCNDSAMPTASEESLEQTCKPAAWHWRWTLKLMDRRIHHSLSSVNI